MKNYVSEPVNIRVKSPYDVFSGQPVNVGTLVGVANCDAMKGEDVVMTTEGVFDFPTKETYQVGDDVHIKEGKIVKKAAGTVKAGVCIGATSNSVRVRIV